MVNLNSLVCLNWEFFCRWKLVNPTSEMAYLPHSKPADEVEIYTTQI